MTTTAPPPGITCSPPKTGGRYECAAALGVLIDLPAQQGRSGKWCSTRSSRRDQWDLSDLVKDEGTWYTYCAASGYFPGAKDYNNNLKCDRGMWKEVKNAIGENCTGISSAEDAVRFVCTNVDVKYDACGRREEWGEGIHLRGKLVQKTPWPTLCPQDGVFDEMEQDYKCLPPSAWPSRGVLGRAGFDTTGRSTGPGPVRCRRYKQVVPKNGFDSRILVGWLCDAEEGTVMELPFDKRTLPGRSLWDRFFSSLGDPPQGDSSKKCRTDYQRDRSGVSNLLGEKGVLEGEECASFLKGPGGDGSIRSITCLGGAGEWGWNYIDACGTSAPVPVRFVCRRRFWDF